MDHRATMHDEHAVITKTATEARQGQTLGVMRWVLLISIVAAIVALALTYWGIRGF